MEEDKKECKPGFKNVNPGQKLYGAEFGEAVASIAIDAMRDEEAPRDAARAFIKKCVSENRNPLDVVKRVAGRYGISISRDAPPDNEKKHIYYLLREVVEQVVSKAEEDLMAEDEGDVIERLVRNVFECSLKW